MSNNRIITRTALLLALTLLFQSLRLFIPIPPFLSSFIIGSLVNACLLVAAEKAGLWSGLFIAVLAPIVAYFQMMLPIPVFIIPVALGNAAYICLFLSAGRRGRLPGIVLATMGKAGLLYAAFTWLLTFIAIPAQLASGIMLAMSWPQIVTGILGGLLACIIVKRIP
jgi:hypothetical protein